MSGCFRHKNAKKINVFHLLLIVFAVKNTVQNLRRIKFTLFDIYVLSFPIEKEKELASGAKYSLSNTKTGKIILSNVSFF